MQALYLCLVLSVSGVGLVFLVEWSWHANRSSKIHKHAHLQCPLQNLTMHSNVKIGPFVCICLLPARLFACGEIGMWLICSRATLSTQPWRRKIFLAFQQQNQHYYSFWCERGLSLRWKTQITVNCIAWWGSGSGGGYKWY